MKLTYLITEIEPSKNSCFTRQTIREVVAVKKDVKDSDTIDDFTEKYVLLRSWIADSLIEGNIYLIVGWSTVKEICECLEEVIFKQQKIKSFNLNNYKVLG